MKRLIHAIATLPAHRPRSTLLAALLLAALCAWAVSRLRADTSLEPMFSRDDPAGRAMLRVMDQFSAAEELIVLASIREDDPGPQLAKLIALAQRLESALQAPAGAALSFTDTPGSGARRTGSFTSVSSRVG